mmetsp:Transcript_63656/g.170559  ORF Transcript_63656/g.170559 Transcript_63656/m.170559 type:complete len:411 (+) Transcript_63656:52-1284(+)
MEAPVFRRPPKGVVTQHLVITNFGRARGHTQEELEVLLRDFRPTGAWLGGAALSHVSFACESDAAAAQAALDRRKLGTGVITARYAELGEVKLPGAVVPAAQSLREADIPGLKLLTEFISEEQESELLAAIDTRPWDTTVKRRVQHDGYAFDYHTLKVDISRKMGPLPDFVQTLLSAADAQGCGLPDPDQLTINEYLAGVGIAWHVDTHSAFEDTILVLSIGAPIVLEFRLERPDAGAAPSEGIVSKKLATASEHDQSASSPRDVSRDTRETAATGGPAVCDASSACGTDTSSAQSPTRGGAVDARPLWVPARSLLVMSGESRLRWHHGIASRSTDTDPDGATVPRGRRISLTFRRVRNKWECRCPWAGVCDTQRPASLCVPTRLKPGATVAELMEERRRAQEAGILAGT